MLVDLTVRGKVAIVVGSGAAARSRARMLRKEGARVILLSGRTPAPRRARNPRAPAGRPRTPDVAAFVKRRRPCLVFATTWNGAETRAILRAAHQVGALVHVYDTPELSDFTMPSLGSAGDIRFAVSSSGNSPAMAVLLRRRMERTIRPVDVALVRLQGRLRPTILRSIPTHEGRREAIYRILRSRAIGRLLRAGRFNQAVTLARQVVAASARAGAPNVRASRR